jgi:hypothetical protein
MRSGTRTKLFYSFSESRLQASPDFGATLRFIFDGDRRTVTGVTARFRRHVRANGRGLRSLAGRDYIC